MIGSVDDVLYAAIAFVGLHALPSTPLKPAVVRRVGENAWRGLFSLLSLILFGWMVWAFAQAPVEPIWIPGNWTRWLAVVVMPFALFFFIGGVTTRNPVAVGMERTIAAPEATGGVTSITRHPLFWGIALWAAVHVLANGDRASVIFFGALMLLSLAGITLVDRKKEAQLGAPWGPFALKTSALPFVAALQRRNRIDWRGIGWWRPALTLVLYGALMGGHRFLFGVAPHPM